MKTIEINGRKIGNDHLPYIIAEISGNHNGNIEKALNLISIAKDCGADAVKIQTYTPDTMTIDCDNDEFKIKGGLWNGHTLYDLYKWAYTPWEWHEKLFEKAKEVGITIFSTPFDDTSIDFLEKLDVPAYKVASFEATDIPLIENIAKRNKPVILSTGMASLEEITESVETIKKLNDQLIVLHCVSSYPAPASQYNLKTIADLAQKFNVISGLSDHTLGTATAVASVSLGARVIEKHFIHSRADKGPDSEFSIEPDEFKKLVSDVKIAWEAIGEANYERVQAEKANTIFRRSIYVVEDIKAGEAFTKENVRRIRPGHGLEPKYFYDVLKSVASQDIKRGTALSWDLVNKE